MVISTYDGEYAVRSSSSLNAKMSCGDDRPFPGIVVSLEVGRLSTLANDLRLRERIILPLSNPPVDP